MRISAIDIYTSDVEFLSVNLQNPSSSDKYLVKAIVGLDADELNPRFYGFGTVEGAKYKEFTRKAREIVMRIVLNPNYKLNERYSDIRDDFYKAISGNRTGEIRLVFRYGATSIAHIYGHITKLEVPHFSKVPELQITIRCEDPLFRGVAPVELVADDVDAGTDRIEIVDAASTAPHGFTLVTTLNAGMSKFELGAVDSDWKFTINYTFWNGDVVTISSEYNAKQVSVLRSSVTTHIMEYVDTDSYWPVIFPGFNEFYWYNKVWCPTKAISYRTAYWGV